MHLISAGKTATCEPHEAMQAKYPKAMCSHTDNHWANHATQCAWMKRAWDIKVAEYMQDGLSNEAAEKAPYVHMLDCWPVNLTLKFREWVRDNCPGCELMFVPAGATGRMQVNDTHLHQPLKAFYRSVAHAWYRRKVTHYRSLLKSADVDKRICKGEYEAKVKSLMSMPRLRNNCLEWLVTASESLAAVPAGERCISELRCRRWFVRTCGDCCCTCGGSCGRAGTDRSLIGKGWHDLYLARATDPVFQATALQEHEARATAAAAAAAAAKVSAIASAVAAAAVANAAAGAAAIAAASQAAALSAVAAVDAAAAAAPLLGELDPVVAAVAAFEEKVHLAEVPQVQERRSRTGKKRDGGRARCTYASAAAAAELDKSDSDKDVLALSGGKRKQPRKPRAALAGAGASAGAAAEAKPPPAKRRRPGAAAAAAAESSEDDSSSEEEEGEEEDVETDDGSEPQSAAAAAPRRQRAAPRPRARAPAAAARSREYDEDFVEDELRVPGMWVCYTECSSGLTSSKALKWLTATKALITSVISQCRDEEMDSRAERWQEQLEAINAAVALVPTDGGVAVCSLNMSV